MSKNTFCVFCGEKPSGKTKEHVLPQWLLRFTGDPSRVVKFGINFRRAKLIEFSWSSFVVPACSSCNERFGALEDQVKPLIERLTNHEPISGEGYLEILDWLDKVRVGVWLAYHLILKNPANIQPKFHIESRLGTKDRLIAIYPIETDNIGLNMFGVESFAFQRNPSCFALRVNNLLILNMSVDYLFSGRCGFPFPKVKKVLVGEEMSGMLHLGQFDFSGRVRHPIMKKRLCKPSVLIYQPIMQIPWDTLKAKGIIVENFFMNSFIENHTLALSPSRFGVLFRQHPDRVEVIRDLSNMVEFNLVLGNDCKPIYQLVAQVYEFQNYILDSFKPMESNAEQKKYFIKTVRLIKNQNNGVSNFLKSQPVARV